MGKFSQARQRPLHRQEVDRLRRSPLALVRHLRGDPAGRDRRAVPSRASTAASSSPVAPSTSVTLPADQVNQDDADELREAVADTGIDDASSPVVTTRATSAIIVQTEPLTDDESDAGRRRHPRDRPASTPTATSRSPRSAPAGARRSPSASSIGLGGLPGRSWCSSSGPTSASGRCPSAALVALAHDVVDHHRRLRPVGLRGDPGDRHRRARPSSASRSTTPSWSSTRCARTPRTSARTHQTYAEAANLAVNQTLVRSINTSIVALIPVGAILYVSAVQLGSAR